MKIFFSAVVLCLVSCGFNIAANSGLAATNLLFYFANPIEDEIVAIFSYHAGTMSEKLFRND